MSMSIHGAGHVGAQPPTSPSASTGSAHTRLEPATDEHGRESDPSSVSPSSARRADDAPSELRTLTPEEQRIVAELRARDREVRAHEQAHLRAAGHLASGGPKFEYEQGPDGKRYAVGGEVPIRIPQGGSREEKLANAQRAQRAALAPANPSGQDRAVAARAAAMAREARAEEREESDSPAEGAVSASERAADGEESRSAEAELTAVTTQEPGEHAPFTAAPVRADSPANDERTQTTFASAYSNDVGGACPLCGGTVDSEHSHFSAEA